MSENPTRSSEHLRWCTRGRAESPAEIAAHSRLRPVHSGRQMHEGSRRRKGIEDG